MGYRPPKGVRPPQLEGKRTGRPRGSRNHAKAWADVLWALEHSHDETVWPPNAAALLWWRFACSFPNEFAYWVEHGGRVVDCYDFYDGY
jgi:hypothetical protein